MRRYGEPVSRSRDYINRPGAYAIIYREGRILLTHQSEPVPEFQLPGGGIDPGEGSLRALHREVIEETGWKIADPRRFEGHLFYTYMPEYQIWARKYCAIYTARATRAIGPPREAHHSAIWVDFDEAYHLLLGGSKDAFGRWLRLQR